MTAKSDVKPCLEMNLQLLVFKLALQLLRLSHLPHSPVEIILINRIAVVLDCK